MQAEGVRVEQLEGIARELTELNYYKKDDINARMQVSTFVDCVMCCRLMELH